MKHETWLFGVQRTTRKGDDPGKVTKTGYGWVCSDGYVEMTPYSRVRADNDAYAYQLKEHGSTVLPHLVGTEAEARKAAEAHRDAMRAGQSSG